MKNKGWQTTLLVGEREREYKREKAKMFARKGEEVLL